jgi:hypothetical protein
VGGSSTSAKALSEESLWSASLARELEPTATYRLRTDVAGQWKRTREVTKEYHCWASRKVSCDEATVCSTDLGTHLEVKVDNYPFVSLWGQMGSFQ